MSLAPLRVAAAAYVLDAISNEDLRRVADEALTRGIYSPSLCELAVVNPSDVSEVRLLFMAAMREVGILLPDLQDGVDRLLSYQCRALWEGTVAPAVAVDMVTSGTMWLDLDSQQSGLTDDTRRLLYGFVDCFYRFKEDEVGRTWPAIEQDVRQLASQWWKDHNHIRIDKSWLYWNDGTVGKMAQAIHDYRRFSNLPLLADALEEAGCNNVELLEHCREQAPHVSDCWVVHLLLSVG